ncbi:MAG: NAD(P)-dependent oxidoreductase [Hydrococcus sp. Prado102]|jgi:nucleoside-diphosphate-sugar epimerase|nr:NAD(P)-dependent oxidoreductase [Hydrococcus sp. Prado102]
MMQDNAQNPIVLITGASGFLGRYVVAEALRRGYRVRAIAREKPLSYNEHPALEWVNLDLRQPEGIAEALAEVNAVIHLAAAKTGDYQTQFATTVTATENLLKAAIEANLLHLIAISTFSVFDYINIPEDATINEDSPIESHPEERDVYAQTKLLQEKAIRNFEQRGARATIIRPGIVYGRDNLWNAYLGAKVGDRFWIRIGNRACLPLTYVENCAEAILAAVNCDRAIGQTLNLIDDDLPLQSTYAQKIRQRMTSPPRAIAIDWTVMRLLAQTLSTSNKLLFKGRVKLPGLFVPARVHARFKPLQFDNRRIKQVLGWTPRYSLDAALDRIYSDADLLQVSTNPASSTPLRSE